MTCNMLTGCAVFLMTLRKSFSIFTAAENEYSYFFSATVRLVLVCSAEWKKDSSRSDQDSDPIWTGNPWIVLPKPMWREGLPADLRLPLFLRKFEYSTELKLQTKNFLHFWSFACNHADTS